MASKLYPNTSQAGIRDGSNASNRGFWSKSLGKGTAWAIDGAMCAAMYAIQRRHRLHEGSRGELEKYILAGERDSRDGYFQGPALSLEDVGKGKEQPYLTWASPVRSAFRENDRTHVDLFPCPRGWEAPTALMLHSLMSTSDCGYRQWAKEFNAQGWNACFIHLPFHYSRTPSGHFNGELAVTADLVRTGEGLRQGVSELRQLMAMLRTWGCPAFGLWASSYGGWIGALLASVEADFRFIALMEPIADVEHAIWTSPAGASLRRELRPRGIDLTLVERHFHLISPLHAEPLSKDAHIILAAGNYDRVAPFEGIAALHAAWAGSETLRVAQGHFGHRMMPATWDWLISRRALQMD